MSHWDTLYEFINGFPVKNSEVKAMLVDGANEAQLFLLGYFAERFLDSLVLNDETAIAIWFVLFIWYIFANEINSN